MQSLDSQEEPVSVVLAFYARVLTESKNLYMPYNAVAQSTSPNYDSGELRRSGRGSRFLRAAVPPCSRVARKKDFPCPSLRSCTSIPAHKRSGQIESQVTVAPDSEVDPLLSAARSLPPSAPDPEGWISRVGLLHPFELSCCLLLPCGSCAAVPPNQDSKRKKKNKKNKGKTAKAVDNLTVGPGESMQNEPEVTHESAPHQNRQETETENAGGQERGEPTQSVDNATPNSEETMQAGSGMNMVNHKAVPEQNLQESDSGIVGTQNASVIDSEGETETHKVMESDLASLEKKIELLQNENEFFAKKEISWNLRFEQLQSEMHSYAIKEASLENKINSMERENDSRIHKENLIGEMVAKLEEAHTGLQMQVKELESSKDNLVQENQQLTSSISLLEARVQLLENEAASFRSSTRMITEHVSEDIDSVKQVEPVSELSEKLIAVEPELVGEVNRQNDIAEHSATFPVPSTEPDVNALHEEIVSEPTDKFASSATFFETISIADVNVNGIPVAEVHPKELRLLDDLHGSAEIVQIPLDDGQVQQADVDAQYIKHEEKDAVPLSDAPLIGAPFRFVSFVAKYVSGADLVKENRRNSGR
ncbi:hypothetical protein Taro_017737 [Colocasia esculenta]|uniref:Uncharacterized protein n=1 Tax=Colocasia esculenta TaxID=4460 RepID=A0A843UPH4_COLES|nr:hypothetical protein [Colocasia esculenta]